jgi:hypothetical protein
MLFQRRIHTRILFAFRRWSAGWRLSNMPSITIEKNVAIFVQKKLVIAQNRTYLAHAQFRTCLWLCADWWASGQEARQPPEQVHSLRDCSIPDRQPEAKPANPALNGGRDLKQRRSGLFWSRWPSKGQHRRGLSIIATRAVGVSPSNPRQHGRL